MGSQQKIVKKINTKVMFRCKKNIPKYSNKIFVLHYVPPVLTSITLFYFTMRFMGLHEL